MKHLTCELCGGTDIVKEEGAFVCQSCGMKYSVEEAKKMMAEAPDDGMPAPQKSAPSSTNSSYNTELNNLYELARRAKNDGNSENAQKYYEQIIVKDPSSWEANFYSVYYQSMNCKIAGIQSAAIRLSNCEDTVLELIRDHVTDPDERRKAVDEVAAKLITISRMLFNAAKNHYDGIGYQIKSNYTQEYLNNCCAARDILYNYGDYLIKFFGDEYGKNIAVPCWKVGIEEHMVLMPNFANKELNKTNIEGYAAKIKKYDESYVAPEINTTSGGCYVATAVYGSYDCPQVWTLRRYRDNTLAASWYGRLFIHLYYAVSPTLVKLFGNTNWFKNMWRGKLDRMVRDLQAQGVESTPYEDKVW